MKTSVFTIFIFLFLVNSTFSQTYWMEDFGTGCNQGTSAVDYVGTVGQWTMTETDTNGTGANNWLISATSSNAGAGSCDDACGLQNPTLHIANIASSPAASLFCPTGDCGAAYDASGCYQGNCCFTSKRIESPVIDLTGKSSLEMTFIFIHGGAALTDFCRLWFFDGSNWNADITLPSTLPNQCGVQSKWTYLLVNLPSYANNNPNFRVGFEWKNNNDGNGSDPSVSIDDIKIGNGFISVNEMELQSLNYYVSNNRIYFESQSVFHIQIFDVSGKLVFEGNSQSDIYLENQGLYLAKLFSDNSERILKIII